MAPPLLYDLTELQRHANRLYGFSAQRTLELAQALYERHKLISYPRTDSRHLSSDVAETLPEVVQAIAGRIEPLLAPGTGERPLGRRFVDDAKVTDHHAIIPTPTSPDGARLSPDEQQDLRPGLPAAARGVARRSRLVGDDGDHGGDRRAAGGVAMVDRFHSSGTAVEQMGWKVLDIGGAKPPKEKPGKAEKDGRRGQEPEESQDLPAGAGAGAAAAGGGRGGGEEDDAAAEAVHGGDAADGDGDGGQDAG